MLLFNTFYAVVFLKKAVRGVTFCGNLRIFIFLYDVFGAYTRNETDINRPT